MRYLARHNSDSEICAALSYIEEFGGSNECV